MIHIMTILSNVGHFLDIQTFQVNPPFPVHSILLFPFAMSRWKELAGEKAKKSSMNAKQI